MQGKKFRSRNGEPVRVALLSSQVAIVGAEWRDLPEIFHSAAYSAGCISDDMVVNEASKQVVESGLLDKVSENAMLEAEVRGAIQKAIDENNIGAFTKNNGPKAQYLRDELGKTIPNHVKTKVWEDMLDKGAVSPLSNDSDELRDDIN